MRKKKELDTYLKSMGVSVIKEFADEIEKKGFVKVDDELAERLDSMLGILPEVISQKNNAGAYRVIYDKGLGILQQAKGKPGMNRANIVAEGTNNNIVGEALLQKIGPAPQIIANVFEVASIIVGQYYMSHINDNLSKINANISSIEQFLSNEKRAELESVDRFLSGVEENILTLFENEKHLDSTLTNIQSKRIDAYNHIKFYEMQIESRRERLNKKDKKEAAVENIKELVGMISEYWMSVYLYCKAYSLEVYLSGNTSEKFYENAIFEMTDVCNRYQERYVEWKKHVADYFSTLKDMENNRILDRSRKMKDVIPLDPYSATFFVLGNLADIFYELDDNKKNEISRHINNIINNDQCKSIEEMEDYINSVIDIMTLNNRRVEILKNEEGTFIKKEEISKEELCSTH